MLSKVWLRVAFGFLVLPRHSPQAVSALGTLLGSSSPLGNLQTMFALPSLVASVFWFSLFTKRTVRGGTKLDARRGLKREIVKTRLRVLTRFPKARGTENRGRGCHSETQFRPSTRRGARAARAQYPPVAKAARPA